MLWTNTKTAACSLPESIARWLQTGASMERSLRARKRRGTCSRHLEFTLVRVTRSARCKCEFLGQIGPLKGRSSFNSGDEGKECQNFVERLQTRMGFAIAFMFKQIDI